jgi:glucose-6-phosphate dehydrogenase assembly protein OpcA
MHVARSQSVEIGAVERALNELWRDLTSVEEEHGGHPTVRSVALNFVVCSLFVPEAKNAGPNLPYIIDRSPCRAIVLVPALHSGGGVRAAVSAHCRLGLLDGTHVCGEEIIVSVPTGRFDDAVSAVRALLIPDLPVYVWWRGNGLSDSKLFQKFLELSDRFIVDSADFSDPAHLAALAIRGTAISDLSWERIKAWRQLTAQFFHGPDQRPLLDSIRHVEIEYGPRSHAWQGIAPEAVLFSGWLASCLGWRCVSKEHSGLRLVVYLMSSLGRMVRLTFQPTSDDGIAGIRIETNAPKAMFSIARMERTQSLQTGAELPQIEPIMRVVHKGEDKTEDLVLSALQLVDTDVLYEQALSAGHAIVSDTPIQEPR